MAADGGQMAGGGKSPGVGRRTPTAGLLVGVSVLAGLGAWGLGELTLNLVRPVTRQVNAKGITLLAADRWGETAAAMGNAAVAFVLLGGLLGAGAGAVGARGQGSSRRTVGFCLLGLGLGAVLELGLSTLILPPYAWWRYEHPDEAARDLVFPILVYPGIWAGAGAAAGLAFALGGRRRHADAGQSMLVGALGAALGGAAYLMAEALLFPSGDTIRFVSATGLVRLGARLAVAIGAAIALATATSGRAGAPEVTAVETPTDPTVPEAGQGAGAGSTTV